MWAIGDTMTHWAYLEDPDSIISTDWIFTDQIDEATSYLLYTTNDTLQWDMVHGKSRCFCQYYIPNHFTPDGDMFNEIFKPVVNCEHSGIRMTIFNREQLVVFDETGWDVQWDGRNSSGAALQTGVYPYIISILTEEYGKVTLEGFVLLAP